MDQTNCESLAESVFAELGFCGENRKENQYPLLSTPLTFDSIQQDDIPINVVVEEGITETSAMIPNFNISTHFSNPLESYSDVTYSNHLMEGQPSPQPLFSFPNSPNNQHGSNEYPLTISKSTTSNINSVSYTFSGGQIYQNLTTATSKI